jgi:hypothetical protein
MEKLLSHFLARGVPVSEISAITEAFKLKKISKGDFFAEEGKTSKYLPFITTQAELFATVMPGFRVWGLAGFIGSTPGWFGLWSSAYIL